MLLIYSCLFPIKFQQIFKNWRCQYLIYAFLFSSYINELLSNNFENNDDLREGSTQLGVGILNSKGKPKDYTSGN